MSSDKTRAERIEEAGLRAKLAAAEARIAEIAKVAHEGGLHLAGGVDTALNEVRRLTLDRWVPSEALTASQRARIAELGKGGA